MFKQDAKWLKMAAVTTSVLVLVACGKDKGGGSDELVIPDKLTPKIVRGEKLSLAEQQQLLQSIQELDSQDDPMVAIEAARNSVDGQVTAEDQAELNGASEPVRKLHVAIADPRQCKVDVLPGEFEMKGKTGENGKSSMRFASGATVSGSNCPIEARTATSLVSNTDTKDAKKQIQIETQSVKSSQSWKMKQNQFPEIEIRQASTEMGGRTRTESDGKLSRSYARLSMDRDHVGGDKSLTVNLQMETLAKDPLDTTRTDLTATDETLTYLDLKINKRAYTIVVFTKSGPNGKHELKTWINGWESDVAKFGGVLRSTSNFKFSR